MKKKAKRLFLLILGTQMICVVAGLWINGHLAVFAARREAEEEVWADLRLGAGELVSSLDELTLTDLTAGSPEARRIGALISANRKSPWDMVTIVNAEGRIVFEELAGRADNGKSPPGGQVVSWTQLPDGPSSDRQLLSAELNFPDGPHIGLVCELTNGPGYILIHRPVAKMAVNLNEISRSLLGAGAIALFWSCALLSPIAYMLLTRFDDEYSREYTEVVNSGRKRAQALVRTRDAIIFGLAKLADSRDRETGAHLERITLYSSLMTTALRRFPEYRDAVTPVLLRLIETSTALHDIGKVGIEDAILLKRGPLTDDERARMQEHTTIGGQCLKKIEECLGSSNFLHMAREIAFCHHERWDGTGYPAGLAGEDIPLSARICAIADIYEALSARRVYKEPMPHEECVNIIRHEAGKQLDPGLVEVFLKIESQFRNVARQYGASVPQSPSPGPAEVAGAANRQVGELVSTGLRGLTDKE